HLADWFCSGSDTESIRKCVTCLVAFSVLFATLIYFNSHLAIRKYTPRWLVLLWLGYRIHQKMRHLLGRSDLKFVAALWSLRLVKISCWTEGVICVGRGTLPLIFRFF